MFVVVTVLFVSPSAPVTSTRKATTRSTACIFTTPVWFGGGSVEWWILPVLSTAHSFHSTHRPAVLCWRAGRTVRHMSTLITLPTTFILTDLTTTVSLLNFVYQTEHWSHSGLLGYHCCHYYSVCASVCLQKQKKCYFLLSLDWIGRFFSVLIDH